MPRPYRSSTKWGLLTGCNHFCAGNIAIKCKNPQPTELRIIAKRRGKMKKKKLSIFIVIGNYEEKKG